MTPFILFLTFAAFVVGLFWKSTTTSAPSKAPTSSHSPSLAPSYSKAPASSLAPTTYFAPSQIHSDMKSPFPFIEATIQTISEPVQEQHFHTPPIQDWELLHVSYLHKNRLSPEQVAILTSQTILDMSILPDLRVEEVDELKEDYDMEDKFRHKSGVLFYTKNMEIEKEKEPDEIQRVKALVSRMYENENWEPVIEKTGPHNYSVSELREKRRATLPPEM